MAARDIENHFEHQYQFAAGWNSQVEAGVLQGDGSSLTSSDAIRAPVVWSDIASSAHADTSTLHVEHGGYERVRSIPGMESNFGISDDTASGHESQQPDSGDACLGNDRQREFLTFPVGEFDAVTISETDLEGLQPMRFLSTNIIDFYIKYLERRLSSEDRNRFYFFNSFFFTKLVGNSGSSTDIEECDVVYDQVRKWTGDVNLFEKDFIFIPILRSSHWSLIIICHLSGLTSSPDELKVSPCILHLDPVEGKHESFREQVRSYLYQACSERYKDSNRKDPMLLAIACRMKFVQAKVPQQANGYDCGLYILHYVEAFLLKSTSPDFSLSPSTGDPLFTSPHSEEEVPAKRVVIQNLISELSNNLQERTARPMDIQPKPQPKHLSKHSPRPQPSRLSKHANGEKKIGDKWNTKETSILLNRMVEIGRIRKGAKGPTHWELISQAIQAELGTTRSNKECRRRYDTLLKAYKKVKQTGKAFCDITDAERREVNLATPLIEEWYEAIDTIRLQRRSDNGNPRKRAKLSPKPKEPSRKQVGIPGFYTLDEDLRSTLLNLIQDLSMKPWGGKMRKFEVVCQRLAAVQDQNPSDIRRFMLKLLELKLVKIKFDDEVPSWLELANVRVFMKFVEEMLRKNPDFDIYLEICDNYDSVSFPKAPLSSSLERIRVLSLFECQKLEHADLSCFPELRSLSIGKCYNLKVVTGWEVVKELGWLEVCECRFYVGFPPLNCLPSLRECGFFDYGWPALEKITSLPDFSQCVRLRRLEIFGEKFSAVNSMDLSTLRFLEVLTLGRFSALTTIQGLSGLHSLTKLNLKWCSALTTIEGLSGLHSLTELKFVDCSVLTTIHGLSGLHSLTKLELYDCSSLTTIQGLSGLHSLTKLELRFCSALTTIPGLSGLHSLTKLKLYRCSSLATIHGLSGLHSLTKLELSDCSSLAAIQGLSGLHSLTELKFVDCPVLTTIQGLSGLHSLTKLELSDCSSLTTIEGSSGLHSFMELELYLCSSLTTIQGLSVLHSLTKLKFVGCAVLTTIQDLSGLHSLTKLQLEACSALTTIQGWSGLHSLTKLQLGRCSALTTIQGWSGPHSLTELELYECPSLTTIPGLSVLHSLTKLGLRCCSALRRVPELGCLKALTHLDLRSSGVEEIPGVQELHLLTHLNLSRCYSLKTLPCLGHLKALTYLYISESGVEEVPGVQDLVSLEKISFF